jgi:hypothetical protein
MLYLGLSYHFPQSRHGLEAVSAQMTAILPTDLIVDEIQIRAAKNAERKICDGAVRLLKSARHRSI